MAKFAGVIWGFSMPFQFLMLVQVLGFMMVGPGLLFLEGVYAEVAPEPLFDESLLHLIKTHYI